MMGFSFRGGGVRSCSLGFGRDSSIYFYRRLRGSTRRAP